MSSKQWGEFFVAQTSPVDYKANAFDALVLEEEKKATILAAVSNSTGFSDIVEGKGGGCVFLLHGPPGVGKTLTAEATAEYLHMPLYTLTSGELGTSATQLEKNLSKVLQLAASIDAVILIDECDIFLNARDGSDVMRNALVGIFLRLLEYHKGILFLTTNRVDVFDAAVYSRVSVALEYSDLTEDNRQTVWRSLLQAAEVDVDAVDVVSLAKIPANGRQIKNAVRLGKALSQRNQDRVCGTTDLTTAIKVAQDFKVSVHNLGDKHNQSYTIADSLSTQTA
jgi:SpoVK/Ycf46/Vps4 family AAA+-type ATPase